MNQILASQQTKGRTALAVQHPLECPRCHSLCYVVINAIHTQGETVCIACEGDVIL